MIFLALLLAAGQQAPQTHQEKPADKLICRTIHETGSRLLTHRECKTKKGWEADEKYDQDRFNRGRDWRQRQPQ